MLNMNVKFTFADKVILILYIVLFFLGGSIILLYTMGLSMSLSFWGWIVYFLGVLLFYDKTNPKLILKKLLWTARIIGLIMMIIAYCFSIICMNFETNKLMYPVKRYVYVHGVGTSNDELLPKFLYKNSTDYYFRTEGNMLAQDYRPYSYLFIHTDENSLRDYEAIISQNSTYTFSENRKMDSETYNEKLQQYGVENEYILKLS